MRDRVRNMEKDNTRKNKEVREDRGGEGLELI